MDKIIDKRGYRSHLLHQIIASSKNESIKIKAELQTVLSFGSLKRKMAKNDHVIAGKVRRNT
jgi:hypothetical protein